MSYVDEVLDDNPYQYLRYLEPSGTTASDSSGNSRNGSLVGSPSRIDGPIAGGGRAVALNGSSQAVNAAVNIGAAAATMTAEFWIRTEDTRANRYWAGNAGGDYRLQIEQVSVPSAVQVRLPRGTGATSGYNFNLSGTDVWDGEWHHVAIVVSYGTFGVQFYVDGDLHQTVGPNSESAFSAWGFAFYWGGRNGSGTLESPIEADFAECALYTSVLSGARIGAHFDAAAEVPGVTLTVNVTGEGTVDRDPDEEIYDPDDEVELTAVPAEGWEFSHWTGDLSGDTNPDTIVLDTSKTVGVVFVEIPPLPAPDNIEVTITSPTSAIVTWDPVDGADAYQVEARVRAGVEE